MDKELFIKAVELCAKIHEYKKLIKNIKMGNVIVRKQDYSSVNIEEVITEINENITRLEEEFVKL